MRPLEFGKILCSTRNSAFFAENLKNPKKICLNADISALRQYFEMFEVFIL